MIAGFFSGAVSAEAELPSYNKNNKANNNLRPRNQIGQDRPPGFYNVYVVPQALA